MIERTFFLWLHSLNRVHILLTSYLVTEMIVDSWQMIERTFLLWLHSLSRVHILLTSYLVLRNRWRLAVSRVRKEGFAESVLHSFSHWFPAPELSSPSFHDHLSAATNPSRTSSKRSVYIHNPQFSLSWISVPKKIQQQRKLFIKNGVQYPESNQQPMEQ